jgi:hypothetical protein
VAELRRSVLQTACLAADSVVLDIGPEGPGPSMAEVVHAAVEAALRHLIDHDLIRVASRDETARIMAAGVPIQYAGTGELVTRVRVRSERTTDV